MYSIYYRDVIDIARLVKRADPAVQVVIGGNHASSYWNHILKDPAVDHVVVGEGEETFLELCRSLLSRGAGRPVLGTAARDDSRGAVFAGPRPVLAVLTSHTEVIATSLTYLVWLIPVLLLGSVAYMYDGLFLGWTRARTRAS